MLPNHYLIEGYFDAVFSVYCDLGHTLLIDVLKDCGVAPENTVLFIVTTGALLYMRAFLFCS